MGKKIIVACFVMVVFSILFMHRGILSQQTGEEITITTYYPSPWGAYRALRLVPTTVPTACDANNEGALYYDNAQHQTMVCTLFQNAYSWQPVGGRGESGVIIGKNPYKRTMNYNFVGGIGSRSACGSKDLSVVVSDDCCYLLPLNEIRTQLEIPAGRPIRALLGNIEITSCRIPVAAGAWALTTATGRDCICGASRVVGTRSADWFDAPGSLEYKTCPEFNHYFIVYVNSDQRDPNISTYVFSSPNATASNGLFGSIYIYGYILD